MIRKPIKLLSTLLLGGLFAQSVSAAVINFDGVADGTVINNVYAGVTFGNPVGNADIYARSYSSAASGGNVVSVFQTGFPAFDARWGAVDAVFAAAAGKVSIDASIVRLPEGLGTPQNFPKIEVYDTSGNFITSVGWDFSLIAQPGAGGITGYQTLQYESTSNNIGKVRILSGQPGGSPSNFGIFDNLSFDLIDQEVPPGEVPEPGTALLFAIGLMGLLGARKKFDSCN